MKKITAALLFLLVSEVSLAKESKVKIDWEVCAQDLEKNCSGISDNHEKHECLEKAGEKVSKACSDFNHSLEKKFKSHHKKGHKH